VWPVIGVVAVTAMAFHGSPVEAAGFSCSNGSGYDVRTGDSWYGIAERVEVSVQALVDANDATIDAVLTPGDRLCLPADADVRATCTSYTVRSGDSWASIGSRAGSSAGAVARANSVGVGSTIHPGDEICLPAGAPALGGSPSSSASGAGSYTVVRGDSWAAIASRAGVSMRSLLSVNDARSGDLIVPGDTLRLPEGASLASASSVRIDAAPTQGPCGFSDTWGQARSGGRSHQGTDIFPGRGNYVYAVVDGRLTGRVWAGAGRNAGNAWSLTGADGTRYFYAHLSDFAPGLSTGSTVRAGQIIGWVGSTGNASAPHLHFEIRPGGGAPVNPYSILRAQGGCNRGTPYTQPGGWVPDRVG
jgi:murein DD-endopeptidase MepM/ murein hydrolase activator NlpD